MDQNDNFVQDEISLKEVALKVREWWRYLRSKWLLIFLFGFLGASAGLAYSYFKKPIYTATTTFVLEGGEGSSSGLGQYAGLASMVGVDINSGGGIFQGDNILELYKSRTMIEKALLSRSGSENKELLIDRYIRFNKLREGWEKPELLNLRFYPDNLKSPKYSTKKEIRMRDSILGKVVDDISKNYLTVAKPDKKLSIIKVDVKSIDENFSKMFNDELVKNVNEFYTQTKTKKSIKNVEILQYKTDSVRAVMNGAIYSAAVVVDNTPNLNPTRQVQRVVPAQRAQFSAETNKAILSSLVQNLEMAKISLRKETPLIQIIDEPIFPLEKQKLGKVKAAFFGGALLALLTVIFFVVKKVIKDIIS